uniref:Uncharacterized protein n=1 Tax=Anguilla anguilla TaxID=7936 RepID=A0A0E9WRF0_ANGAN
MCVISAVFWHRGNTLWDSLCSACANVVLWTPEPRVLTPTVCIQLQMQFCICHC